MEYRNGLIAPTSSEFPDVSLQYQLKKNKKFQLNRPKFQIFNKGKEKQMLNKVVVTPAGLEPATSSLEDWRSIQLSYGAVAH